MNKTQSKRIKVAQNIESSCSCTSCDSLTCFTSRQKQSPCGCIHCEGSDTCLFHSSKKMGITESCTAGSNLNPTDPTTPTFKRNHATSDSALPKPVISLKKSFDQKTIGNIETHSYIYKLKITNSDRNAMRGHSIGQFKAPENPATHKNVKHSDNDTDSTRIKLRSQLMDIDLNDLKQYLKSPFNQSCRTNRKSPNTSEYSISKLDILDKIKEIYNVCSCKICECLAPTRNKMCACKPCDCDDCLSYLKKSFGNSKPNICKPESKASYRVLEKIKQSQFQDCNCKPCDCIQCSIKSKACHCETCQCMNDKVLMHRQKMLVVAPVGQNNRAMCQCSPCECNECVTRFGVTSNATHEISTGTTRHAQCRCEMCTNEMCDSDNPTCPCERHNKIVNKPVQQDSHDYDIHTVILNNKPFKGNYKKCTQDYVNNNEVSQTDFKDYCASDYNEDVINSIKSSNISLTPRALNIYRLNDICDCRLCQYEGCSNTNALQHTLPRVSVAEAAEHEACDRDNSKTVAKTVRIAQEPHYSLCNSHYQYYKRKVFGGEDSWTKHSDWFYTSECHKNLNKPYLRESSVSKITQLEESFTECENFSQRHQQRLDSKTHEDYQTNQQYRKGTNRHSINKSQHESNIISEATCLNDNECMNPPIRRVNAFWKKSCHSSSCHPIHAVQSQNSRERIMKDNIVTSAYSNIHNNANKVHAFSDSLLWDDIINENETMTRKFKKLNDNKKYLQKYNNSYSHVSFGHAICRDNLHDEVLKFDEDLHISLSGNNSTQTSDYGSIYLSSSHVPRFGIYLDNKAPSAYENDTNFVNSINDEYIWNCDNSTQYSNPISSANSLSNTDHERVCKVLQEAKNFSHILQNMLQTFEKANSDFESVYKKLEFTHSLQISSNNADDEYCDKPALAEKYTKNPTLEQSSRINCPSKRDFFKADSRLIDKVMNKKNKDKNINYLLFQNDTLLEEVFSIGHKYNKHLDDTDSFGHIGSGHISPKSGSFTDQTKHTYIVVEASAATQTQDKEKEKLLLPVLKKNFELHSMPCFSQRGVLVLPLELEVKAAIQAIGRPRSLEAISKHQIDMLLKDCIPRIVVNGRPVAEYCWPM